VRLSLFLLLSIDSTVNGLSQAVKDLGSVFYTLHPLV